MVGVVLCGGQSRRMGRDKGLLMSAAGICWSTSAFQLLTIVCSRVVLAVNEQQVDSYLVHYPLEQLVTDDLRLCVKGPLLGILSVHNKFPNEDLLVLACDMTDMRLKVIEKLVFEFSLGGCEAAVFRREDLYEPLCSIYGFTGLRKLAAVQEGRKLKNSRMQYILDDLNAKCIEIPEGWSRYFSNYNTPV